MKKNILWGVFFVALSTLCWEMLLTRIFSATMYYHFVFISISLAMLGFGCSGILVFLFPGVFTAEKCNDHLTLASLLYAATTLAAIVVYLNVNFTPDPSFASFVKLFKIFLFIFLPYFFSGLTITLALKHYAKNVTLLYCYDLVGAGIGCLFSICMLFIYDGLSLVILSAGIAAWASLLFSRSCTKKLLRGLSISAVVFFCAAFFCNAYLYRFLKIKYVAGARETGVVFEKWNPINRVTVVPEAFFNNKLLRINYDSAALAHMHFYDGTMNRVSYLKKHLTSFYYQLRNNADVLIIGVGGGQDVLNAHINGEKNITGIEINPTIAKLNTDIYRDFNDNLFSKPGIRLVVDDGRNFIRHAADRYDIIHLSNVDSGVASSSGAFTFVENSLYTVEAYKDYFSHLKDDGVLWISRWQTLDKYCLENFRVLTGLVTALEELGIKHPQQHIVMLVEQPKVMWRQNILLLKKTPFRSDEIQAIDRQRKEMDLLWLYNPGGRMDNELNEYLFAPDREAFLKDYLFRVDPITDDHPFFFNFLKPIHYLWNTLPVATHFTYPVFMFKTLFVIIFIMVLGTIFVPLIIVRRPRLHYERTSYRGGYLLYFSCLGLGFMFVEIPLIQKFILFLGQPLYAMATILSALLISSGLGSLAAGACSDDRIPGRLSFILTGTCALLVLYIFGLPYVFNTFMGTAGYIRALLSVTLIFPLGMMLGTALPLGIRLLEKDGPTMIPWAWGVNGACSVMGSVIAWGLSLNFGYTVTICLAALMYAVCLLIMALKPAASGYAGQKKTPLFRIFNRRSCESFISLVTFTSPSIMI